MFEVHTISAFSDNYLWLFQKSGTTTAYAVDPGDSAPVLATLEKLQLRLGGIFVTHHHHDHIGGIETILSKQSVPVYGPEGVTHVDHPVVEGDTIDAAGVKFKVIALPGHTLNHLAYFADLSIYEQSPVLFCGDTLFACGCGRLFEGTAKQMHHSLGKLSSLPPSTQVYCAHEYTLANMAFALTIDPNNTDLQHRYQLCQNLRQQNMPTVPFTLEDDLKTNPFLRTHTHEIMAAANEGGEACDPVSVFASIRDRKDNF